LLRSIHWMRGSVRSKGPHFEQGSIEEQAKLRFEWSCLEKIELDLLHVNKVDIRNAGRENRLGTSKRWSGEEKKVVYQACAHNKIGAQGSERFPRRIEMKL
jgi:hypothetical protein